MWRPRCPAEEARTGCRAVRGAERVSFRTSAGWPSLHRAQIQPSHIPGIRWQSRPPHTGSCWAWLESRPNPLFHGCGTQNQNFADRQHPGVCGDYPVLSLLQDPGPIRGAHPDRAHLWPETESQEWQSFKLGGQAVHPSETGEAGGCGLQSTQW